MLSKRQKQKINQAFQENDLEVKSISPGGDIEWKPITAVHRNETSDEKIVSVETEHGDMILTADHSVYTSPIEKTPAENLEESFVQGVYGSMPFSYEVKSVKQVDNRQYMYDLTVADNHNFLLDKSQVFVSNCPDRNYHFRPPTSEGTMSQKNRAFSYIWTDEELIEYMQRGVDFINMWPPETHWNSINQMVKNKPAWRQMILMAAIAHAAMALTFNWVADEFDYSIGGVSLSIDKSSKYESLKSNAESQLDKMLQAKERTVKIIRGLKQSRYGVGVRSSWGPHTGSGVLTPRKYLGF